MLVYILVYLLFLEAAKTNLQLAPCTENSGDFRRVKTVLFLFKVVRVVQLGVKVDLCICMVMSSMVGMALLEHRYNSILSSNTELESVTSNTVIC
jgi:hypothetical protein